MTEWHRLGISELLSAYARGETSPVEVIDHFLARIGKFNPNLHAIVSADAELARASARASEARFKADTRRPLEGVPVAVKANIALAGKVLDAGMVAREGMVAEEDAVVVSKLRAAGAVIIGTTNMHEAAMGATTDNPWFGTCFNPHGEGRTPGGSSGGSGAAVAAGLCAAAIGTDTLGSIRIPASYCGIFGLKPTHGVAPMHGIVPLCSAFDTVGPMTRSMDDLSVITNVILTPDLASAMRRSRFRRLANLGGTKCQPEVEALYSAIIDDLHEPPTPILLPVSCSEARMSAVAITARALAIHLVALGEARCSRLSQELIDILEFGMSRDEATFAEDRRIVATVGEKLREEIGSNGVLITPTTPHVAFPQAGPMLKGIADFTCLANLSGLPAISLPVGLDRLGLPIGLQLIGPPGGEAMLIAQARMINDRVRGYAPPGAYW